MDNGWMKVVLMEFTRFAETVETKSENNRSRTFYEAVEYHGERWRTAAACSDNHA